MSASQIKLAAVCIASVGIGIAANRIGLFGGPGINGPKLFTASPTQLRRMIGLPAKWAEPASNNGAFAFLLLLVAFFRDVMDAPGYSGRALTALVLSIWAPLAQFQTIESLKSGQSLLLSPAAIIFLCLAGQAFMIGAVTPGLFVPLYAMTLYLRKKSSKASTLPSLSTKQLNAVKITHLIAALSIAPTLFLPTRDGQIYAIGNIIFQFFPLAFIPLLFQKKSTSGDKSSSSATVEFYKLFKWISTAVYLVTVAIAAPALLQAAKKRKFSNDGVHLLFVDALGLSAGLSAIVMLDRWSAGTSMVKATDLVHLVKGFLLGPGHGAASYFASREKGQSSKKSK